MKLIYHKFQCEQLISLQFDTNRSWSSLELKSLSMFKNIQFISFLNLSNETQIEQYQTYFPNVTCIQLYYNTNVDSTLIQSLNLNIRVWIKLKRLEIHTTGLVCSDYEMPRFMKERKRFECLWITEDYNKEPGVYSIIGMSIILP